jgi:hypothetical protein
VIINEMNADNDYQILRHSLNITVYLLLLDVSKADMHYIPAMGFIMLHHLTILKLTNNEIHAIEPSAFEGLSALKILKLKHNKLTSLPNDLLQPTALLIELDISDNLFDYYGIQSKDIFLSPPLLSMVYVVHPETCCLLHETSITCHADLPKADTIGSCQDVIASPILKYATALLATFCLLLNGVGCIWWKVQSRVKIQAQHILGLHLNISDGLMSLYLFIVIIMSSVSKGDAAYVLFIWTQSTLCKISGIIFMMSVELSTVSALLISIDRFICMVWKPYQVGGFRVKTVMIMLPTSWLLSGTLPVLTSFLSSIPFTNSACFLVGSSLPHIYSLVYICANSTLFFSISVLYILIIKNAHQSAHQHKQETYKGVYIRLGAVILTNFLAWLAISLVSIMSILNISLFPYVEATFAFILFPLNSIFNPIINIIATRSFYQLVCGICHNTICVQKTVKRQCKLVTCNMDN